MNRIMSYQYIEEYSDLSDEQRNVIRAFKSIQEEVEATDFYYQRYCVTKDEKLKEVLFHNMLEEIEHTNMLMGYVNMNMPDEVKYTPKYDSEDIKDEVKDLVTELSEGKELDEVEKENESVSDEEKEKKAVESSKVFKDLINKFEQRQERSKK